MRHLSCLRLAFVFMLLSLCGCEIPTSTEIHLGPTFSLHGSGRLASFRVYGPSPGRKIATPFDAKSLMWAIQPSDGYFSGALVERLEIKYGKVPMGYAQTVPATAAATLNSGRVYWFFAETTGAPGADGFFFFDGAATIKVEVPGLCQSGFIGDVKPLKCGTSEPFVEPRDLEQFVKDHRVGK